MEAPEDATGIPDGSWTGNGHHFDARSAHLCGHRPRTARAGPRGRAPARSHRSPGRSGRPRRRFHRALRVDRRGPARPRRRPPGRRRRRRAALRPRRRDRRGGRRAAAPAPAASSATAPGRPALDVLLPHEGFSLHPLMTVPGAARTSPAPAPPSRRHAARAGRPPRSLAAALGHARRPRRDADRAAYHAAASIASNFLVTLEAAAERLAASAGVDRALLVPLVRATVENWAAHGPEAALTGPIARGDEDTVARQREAVAERAPDLVEALRRPRRGHARPAAGRTRGRAVAESCRHEDRRAPSPSCAPRCCQPRRAGRTIGLVPTMGALHDGPPLARARRRASAATSSSSRSSSTPRSSTSRPTWPAYPRDEARDAALAAEAGADLLFAPAAGRGLPARASPRRCASPAAHRVARGRAPRRRALRRRGHRRHEAPEHGRARRRLLRPEGRPAGRSSSAASCADLDLPVEIEVVPHRPRARRPGALEPQRPPARRRPRARAGPQRRALDAARDRLRRRRARRRRPCTRAARAAMTRASPSSPSTSRSSHPETLAPLAAVDGAGALVAVAARVGLDPPHRQRPPRAPGERLTAMQRTMLKSKIHRATVTDCDLHYVGSITIDPDLLEAADILEHEQVARRRRRQRRPLRDLHHRRRARLRRREGQRRRRPPRAPRRHRDRHLLRRLRRRRPRAVRAQGRARRGRARTASSTSTPRWRRSSPRARRPTAERSHQPCPPCPRTSSVPADASRLPMTLPRLAEKKRLGEPIVMVTAYDYPSARAAEAAGVDLVLVGDSGAMTVLGYASTVPVELDELLVLAKAARRGPADAVPRRRPALRLLRGQRRAGGRAPRFRFVKEAGCDAVKLEGGGPTSVARARAIVARRHPGHGPRRPDAADLDRAGRLPGPGPHGRRGRADRRARRSPSRRPAASRSSSRRSPRRSPSSLMDRTRGPGDRHRRRPRDRRPGARLPRPARHPRGPRRALRQALRDLQDEMVAGVAAFADDVRGRALPGARARLLDRPRRSSIRRAAGTSLGA